MVRRRKWVAAGIYQPASTPRHAYGPRAWTPRDRVDDAAWASAAVEAASIARYPFGATTYQLVAVNMPRGGVRYLLVCPRCARRVTRLYERFHPFFRRYETACRGCWSLRYRSQYEGRRLEAHPDYLSQVTQRQIARTPRDVTLTPCAPLRLIAEGHTHRRRMARYDAVQDLLDRRQRRYIARRETAYTLSMMVLLAREVNRENRQWARRILPAVLRDPNLDTRRQIAQHPDTPAWAREAILGSLSGGSAAKTAAKPTKKPTNMHETAHEKPDLATLVSEERIAELRAAYAALGQARRHKRAA